MNPALIELLACPDCGRDLRLSTGEVIANNSIESGILNCLGCNRTFPISSGIPRLMPLELLREQQDEMAARDAQVNDYDAMWYLNLFGKVEIPMTLRRLNIQGADCVLEAGCGTGRMTGELAARSARIFAIDFSFQSLRANSTKLRAAGIENVMLAQADLCHLPFKAESFERAVSCQVLEHIPTAEAREAAVKALNRVVKAGATVVVSAYQHSRWTREKEGKHEGGIPFFRFTQEEFAALLGTHFDVRSITGSLQYIYLAELQKN